MHLSCVYAGELRTLLCAAVDGAIAMAYMLDSVGAGAGRIVGDEEGCACAAVV